MEKSYCLNIPTYKIVAVGGNSVEDIGLYFEIFKYILMAACFIALMLIFLNVFYGEEEKTT